MVAGCPSLAVCPSNPQEESHRQQTHHSLEPHNRAAQALWLEPPARQRRFAHRKELCRGHTFTHLQHQKQQRASRSLVPRQATIPRCPQVMWWVLQVEAGQASQQSGAGSAAAASGSAEALRASQGSAQGGDAVFAPPVLSAAPKALSESGCVPQQSTGGVTQAADASLAQASQQSSTGSVAGAPGSAEALRASLGIVRGADIRTSTTSEAAARVSQPGAQAGHNSQWAASGVMGAPGEAGHASQQSGAGSAAAASGSAVAKARG